VCIGGGRLQRHKPHTFRAMTFTFQFSSKTLTTFANQKEDSKEQYKEPYTKNDSESDENTSDEDELYFYGDNGTDVINIDSEADEGDASDNNSEPSEGSDEQNVLNFYGDNGTDVLYTDSDEEESGTNDSGSSDEPSESSQVVVDGGGEDSFSYYNGDEADTDQAEMDNTQEMSNSNDEQAGKIDPIVNGASLYEAEKANYIDFWNYDAVNWYTKEDQLAVEDALQSQLIIVDSMGF